MDRVEYGMSVDSRFDGNEVATHALFILLRPLGSWNSRDEEMSQHEQQGIDVGFISPQARNDVQARQNEESELPKSPFETGRIHLRCAANPFHLRSVFGLQIVGEEHSGLVHPTGIVPGPAPAPLPPVSTRPTQAGFAIPRG